MENNFMVGNGRTTVNPVNFPTLMRKSYFTILAAVLNSSKVLDKVIELNRYQINTIQQQNIMPVKSVEQKQHNTL